MPRIFLIVLGVTACLCRAGGVSTAWGEEPLSNPSAEEAAASMTGGRLWLTDAHRWRWPKGMGLHGRRPNGRGPIQLQGRPSPHGIGLTHNQTVGFILDGKYGAFEATVGLDDDSVPSQRQILFKIYADGQLLWESYGMCRPGESQHCLLDVQGVKRLKIWVWHQPEDRRPAGEVCAVLFEPQLRVAPPRGDRPLPPIAYSDWAEADQLDAYRLKVRRLVEAEKFDELEKMAAAARASDKRYINQPVLACFYEAMGYIPGVRRGDAEFWKKQIEACEKWKAAVPDKPTADIALGEAYVVYAWSARGGGPASTVSEEGWRLFRERLALARKHLEAAAAREIPAPHAYEALMDVALGQGWSKEEMLALIEKRMELEPASDAIYLRAARFLTPRWHGGPGELEAFAERVMKELGGERGAKVYAHIALEHCRGTGMLHLLQTDFRYEYIAPGIYPLLRDNPADLKLAERAAFFACLADDQEIAYEILDRGLVNTIYTKSLWGGFTRKRYWYLWSKPDHVGDQKWDLHGPWLGVTALTFPDKGGPLLAAGEAGLLYAWKPDDPQARPLALIERGVRALDMGGGYILVAGGDPDKKEGFCAYGKAGGRMELKVLPWDVQCVWTAQISPDGKYLATGGQDKMAMLWEIGSKKKSALVHQDEIISLAFSADGQKLYTAQRDGKIFRWNVADGKADGLWFKAPPESKIACSPDGKMLAVASRDGALQIYNFEQKRLRKVEGAPPSHALAFSPDSRWLAVGGHDATVAVLDLQRLGQARLFRGHVAPVRALAFSPDGKRLYSAGDESLVKRWDFAAAFGQDAE